MNKQEFKYFYNDNIYPILKPYESERKRIFDARQGFKAFATMFTIGLAIVASIMFISVGSMMDLTIGEILTQYVTLVLLGACALIVVIQYCNTDTKEQKRNLNNFKLKIKRLCLNKILAKIGDMKWAHNNCQEIIDGHYKGVEFKIIETLHEITLSFTSTKKFSSKTSIEAKYRRIFMLTASYIALPIIILINLYLLLAFFLTMDSSFLALMLNGGLISLLIFFAALDNIFKYHGFRKTKIEDNNFNKFFTIYTKDEVEARYFLTPTFIERFKNFENAFGNCKISCSCEGNIVTFTLKKKKDLFEIVDINTPFINPKTIMVLYNEIQAIFDMIEYFKFEENTGI